MRNQKLTGFVIHHRPFGEKRAIYTLFCQGVGLIDGVAKHGLPLFCELDVLATGKRALKTFCEPILLGTLPSVSVFVRYACLYVNEILYRLLAKEDDAGSLYTAYQMTIKALHALDCPKDEQKLAIKRILRRFEWALFRHLGVAVDYRADSTGRTMTATGVYVFCLEQGFVPIATISHSPSHTTTSHTTQAQLTNALTGKMIMAWRAFLSDSYLDDHFLDNVAAIQSDGLSDDWLDKLGVLHKAVIDFLLEYKPLNSRKLWQAHERLLNAH